MTCSLAEWTWGGGEQSVYVVRATGMSEKVVKEVDKMRYMHVHCIGDTKRRVVLEV